MVISIDLPDGDSKLSRAFNTEAAAQQNSWFEGYKTSVKKMTNFNHDFFVYLMLFLKQQVWIRRQEAEKQKQDRVARKERQKRRAEVWEEAGVGGPCKR